MRNWLIYDIDPKSMTFCAMSYTEARKENVLSLKHTGFEHLLSARSYP